MIPSLQAFNLLTSEIKNTKSLTILKGELCDIETINILREYQKLKKNYNIYISNINQKNTINSQTNIVVNMEKDYIFLKNKKNIKENFYNHTINAKISSQDITLNERKMLEILEGTIVLKNPILVSKEKYTKRFPLEMQKVIIDTINNQNTLPNLYHQKKEDKAPLLILYDRGNTSISKALGKVFTTKNNQKNTTIFFPTQSPINEKNVFLDIYGTIKKTGPLLLKKPQLSTKSLLLNIYQKLQTP